MHGYWLARQGRHLAYVAEFTSDLRHLAGADNVVADCLSRPPEELSLPRSTKVANVKVPSRSLAAPADRDGSSGASTVAAAVVPATQQGPVRWGLLAKDQLTCQETQEVLTSNTSLLLERVVYQGANLWCDTSTGALGPLVPVSQRWVHELSHAGWRAMRRLVATRFV